MKPDRLLRGMEKAVLHQRNAAQQRLSLGAGIATHTGARSLGDLRRGDYVTTRDRGTKPIVWIGARHVQAASLPEHLRPVLLRKGSLGQVDTDAQFPERDMLLAPNQRIQVCRDQTVVAFEEPEVLVAAKHLTGLPGITRIQDQDVHYRQIFFDRTEVILANGVWIECFHPAPRAPGRNAQALEIEELYFGTQTSGALL